MKTRSILFGLSVCAAMCACTDKDVTGTGSEQQASASGKAYMVVNIQDVGSAGSRAVSGYDEDNDGEFQYGQPSENSVDNAHFYFYDKDGVFAIEASIWNGGTGKQHETETGDDGETIEVADGNVEFNGNTVITLKGLTERDYPTYMVTVLNKPENFIAPHTLSDFETALANGAEEGGEKTDDGFVMSTTSYIGNSDGRPEYFVNELVDGNFSEEPIEYDDAEIPTNCEPVVVYVERLAAKVTLTTEGLTYVSSLGEGEGLIIGKFYPITHEVMNDNLEAKDTPLYVKIDGWTLNATARKSNMVKDITNGSTLWAAFTDDANWGSAKSWNDPDNYRSYWGKSFNYGIDADYPSSSAGNYDSDEANSTTYLNQYLKYTSLDGEGVELKAPDESEYCAENTNTVGATGVIKAKNSSAITSILVKATLLNADGEALDYVKYDGLLWTPDNYAAYALEHINTTGKLNVWYKVSDEEYAQIDTDYVEVGAATETDVDGHVRVILNETGKNTIFYYKTGTGDDATYTSYDDDEETSVQDVLDIFNNEYGTDANYYKDGEMYYSIPIEHLNNSTTLAEANYGVVRNHHYYVAITQLEGLGRGIFDPKEVIIPQEEISLLYLSAQVNILSWKIVKQEVTL